MAIAKDVVKARVDGLMAAADAAIDTAIRMAEWATAAKYAAKAFREAASHAGVASNEAQFMAAALRTMLCNMAQDAANAEAQAVKAAADLSEVAR